jgi:hypothetical protein
MGQNANRDSRECQLLSCQIINRNTHNESSCKNRTKQTEFTDTSTYETLHANKKSQANEIFSSLTTFPPHSSLICLE